MIGYEQLAEKTKSEKVLFCTIQAAEYCNKFTLHTGSIYVRDVSYWVSSVKQNSTNLSIFNGANNSLTAGTYLYEPKDGKLYVRMTDSSNPNTKSITIFNTLYFSNKPINAPFDLVSGETVHWDGRISQTGSINQSIDIETSPIAIETSTNISLINSDGFFDEIFDRYIWENKAINIWSWITGLPWSEKRKIFSGVIEDKSFTPDQVSFKAKDFTFKLRDFLNMPRFSSLDGELSDSDIDSPKRRIFGRVKQMQLTGVNKILDGYSIAQTISGTSGGTSITFSSSIQGLINQGDEILIPNPDGTFEKYSVDDVTNTTTVTIGGTLDISFTGVSPIIKPSNGNKAKNRQWHIAGHEIYQSTRTIVNVISPRRFLLNDASNIYVGDYVQVLSQKRRVSNVAGNYVTLQTEISPSPSNNDPLTKLPIVNAYYGNNELIIDRDFTFTNSSEAKLIINEFAERNIAPVLNLTGTNLTFTASSRAVTSSSTSLDLRTVLKPGDWVRSTSISHTTWYEVQVVRENSLRLHEPFAGTTGAIAAQYKSVNIINDDSLITVNTYGLMDGVNWIKTASDSVKYILENDAGLTQLNQSTFSEANNKGGYIISMALPESLGSGLPQIRDAISKISASVFGSLYTDQNFDLCYSILNANRPENLEPLTDDEIISFSVDSKNKIVRRAVVKYRPFVDLSSGESTFDQEEFSSDFVTDTVEGVNTKELICYLFDTNVAQCIAQRYVMFNSLANSTIKIKGKLNLATKNLTDKIYVSFDRLFKRFGTNFKKKVGVVTALSKNGLDTELQFSDLGGVYNRIGSIAPNTAPNYAGSNEDEQMINAFVVDNTTKTPDNSNEEYFGSQLIG